MSSGVFVLMKKYNYDKNTRLLFSYKSYLVNVRTKSVKILWKRLHFYRFCNNSQVKNHIRGTVVDKLRLSDLIGHCSQQTKVCRFIDT